MVALALFVFSLLAMHSEVASAVSNAEAAPVVTGFGFADKHDQGKKFTFSIPASTTANPVASGISLDGGQAYIKYSTVQGFFLQDLTTTDPATFDYTAQNFGLVNRTYDGEGWFDAQRLTQWERFSRYITRLNRLAPPSTSYKLLFLARHGEGTHNSAEAFYTTPGWNCYWAQADGNSTTIWADAALTPSGALQSSRARAYWLRLLREQRITPPQSFYTSPLTRCLSTADQTWRDVPLAYPFRPIVKELLREAISIHTCDRRSSRAAIAAAFPGFAFEPAFAEHDTLWSGVEAETGSAHDRRSKELLDDVFAGAVDTRRDDDEIVSFTAHSGATASLLRVLGHIPFRLATGAVLPVLVRAERVSGGAAAQPVLTTEPWTSSAWCTNAPPVTSVVGGGACVCRDRVQPTAVSPGVVFTSRPTR